MSLLAQRAPIVFPKVGVAMRLSEAEYGSLTERQCETYERIVRGPRKAVRGPFVAWLRSPAFADYAEAMGNYVRFGSSLSKQIVEMTILVVAGSWGASFVWNSHRDLARDAGLSDEQIGSLKNGEQPQFSDLATKCAHAFVQELLDRKHISDRTWNAALAQLGEQGVVDLLGLIGYYGLVAITVIAVELDG